MIPVPMFNLSRVTDVEKLAKAAKDVLSSSEHILGKNVVEFEKTFAKYIGVGNCVGVANGSDAIVIALRALGVQKDDQVGTVANAGFYTSAALMQIGASPVFIDVDPDSLLLDLNDLENKIKTQKIKVVVLTHLYGQVAPIKEVINMCKLNGIKVLEDCAQAAGAQIDNQKVGSFGEISTFSFYPTKNLGAVGDGGAILTNNDDFALSSKKLRQYGWGNKYEVELENGSNSRLDEIQAAFLLTKLSFLDGWNQERISIAKQYVDRINNPKVKILKNTLMGVVHLFVIQVIERKELMHYLSKYDIQFGIHYPVLDHKQKIFQNKFEEIKLPVTEEAVERILSIPIYPGMSQEQINHVILTMNSFGR
jgi:dTDP-4-amino-4,6-dideoxygalactose transaminase